MMRVKQIEKPSPIRCAHELNPSGIFRHIFRSGISTNHPQVYQILAGICKSRNPEIIGIAEKKREDASPSSAVLS